MSSSQNTVRYNNQKWKVDTETDTLSLESDNKVRVSIDEVWQQLCDRDQNLVADIQAARTEREFEGEDFDEDDF